MSEKKTILVTGSSRGIGEGVARLAKAQAYDVVLHGRADSDRLIALAKELDAPYITCDASDGSAVRDAVGSLRRVDVLVNCAGINPSKSLMDIPDDLLRQIYEVNVFGTMFFSKAVVPNMRTQGAGSIVNIASAKAFLGFVGKPIYASAKAAIVNLTAGMAKEFAQYNIRVCCVAPGFVNTDMTKGSMSPIISRQIDGILMGRIGEIEELAKPILFLAGDDASYITGQTLFVDGGVTIQKDR